MTSSLPASRPRRRRIRGTAAALLSAAVFAASPAAVAAVRPAGLSGGVRSADGKPTVVLVHGAFADASSWNAVVERLQKDGYRVVAAANPLRGLATDSASVAGVLRSIHGPIVLVGHSYGGAVISQAATGNPNVKALVYVSALMPDKGEVLGRLAARFPGSALNPALKKVPFRNTDGTTGTDLYVAPDKFHAVFAADLPRTTTSLMAATQRPIAASAFSDKATSAAWRTIPSWAAVATRDKAIAPDVERFEARRAASHVIEIDSSHVGMISHPGAITDLILDAARAQAPATPSMARTGFPTLGLAGATAAIFIAGAGLVTLGRKRPNRMH
jgi:pimeloyl-ACP methyl ester carboxylesterase